MGELARAVQLRRANQSNLSAIAVMDDVGIPRVSYCGGASVIRFLLEAAGRPFRPAVPLPQRMSPPLLRQHRIPPVLYVCALS